jgi:peptidoglycan hydrolase-like protein with peptidoglycan-binding domain
VPEFPANGSTVTQGQQVSFFWQPVNGAASYQLQVANNASFTPPLVLDRKPTGNQVNTSTLPVGTLFWRVRAVDSAGPGAWSATFQLTIAAGGG